MKKDDIAKEIKQNIDADRSKLSAQYENTEKCQAFYAGDFMDYKGEIGKKKKVTVQFNLVKPYVNSVRGFMVQNRRQAKYAAKIESPAEQKKYTFQANSIAEYIRENARADQIETQQDGDLLINGYGAVETSMTYGLGYATTDPGGEVDMGRKCPTTIGWDHTAKEPNLIDARRVWYYDIYHLDDAMKLFDNNDPQNFEMINEDELGEGDYNYFRDGGRYDRYKEVVDWADEDEKMVKVYFYQWYEVESFYRAPNPLYELQDPISVQWAQLQLDMIEQEPKGDMFDFDPKAEVLVFDSKIKAQLQERFGDLITIYENKRKVFYKAIVSGEKVFAKSESESQQGFTLKFKTGDWDAKNKIWVGMVNQMMEPVKYYNKALTELMYTIAVNSKGGVIIEEDAVDDIRAFEKAYAKTDGVATVRSGTISGNKIKDKKSPHISTGLESIVAIAGDAMPAVTGIPPTFMGTVESKNDTGVLNRQRINRVVSTLACFFDAVTLYQKEHARMLLDLMRIYAQNNAGAIFRLLGEEGKESFTRLSEDMLNAEFEVTIQEAPQSSEEKLEHAMKLSGMSDKLLSIGDPAGKAIMAISLKYMGLEQEDVEQAMQALTPQSQVDPMYVKQLEGQLQQLMDEGRKVDMQKTLSEIQLNMEKLNKEAASVEKTRAETAKTLEQAAQTGLENDIVRSNSYSKATVTI